MYPFHAVKTAGDLVVGRRLRILLRLLWLGVMVIVLWLIILIPIILLDGKIKELWPVVNSATVGSTYCTNYGIVYVNICCFVCIFAISKGSG